LYDLNRDPLEMNNVVEDPAYAGILEAMKTALHQEKMRIGDTDDKYPELLAIRDRLW
jgi:hypothetical protein